MRIFVIASIVLMLACGSSQSESQSQSGSQSQSQAPARQAMPVEEIAQQTLLAQPAGDRLVLDVRTPEEYAAGHVPDAINIPHDQLESRLAELAVHKNGPVVLYCKSGRRAGLAAGVLAKAGFTSLLHLTGDMEAWTAAGLPIEKAGS